MRKIFLGLVLSFCALQVSAATLNWIGMPIGHSYARTNASVISGGSRFFNAGDDFGAADTEHWRFVTDKDTRATAVALGFLSSSEFDGLGFSISDGTTTWNASYNGAYWVKSLSLVAGKVYDLKVFGKSLVDGTHYNVRVSAVPIPAAVWMMGTALIGLVSFGRRKMT